MEVSGDYQNTSGHYSSDCLGEDIVKKIEIIFNDPRAEGRGVPEYGSVGAAGLDLRSCDNAMIYPGETVQFPMGYALYIGDHPEIIIGWHECATALRKQIENGFNKEKNE